MLLKERRHIEINTSYAKILPIILKNITENIANTFIKTWIKYSTEDVKILFANINEEKD